MQISLYRNPLQIRTPDAHPRKDRSSGSPQTAHWQVGTCPGADPPAGIPDGAAVRQTPGSDSRRRLRCDAVPPGRIRSPVPPGRFAAIPLLPEGGARLYPSSARSSIRSLTVRLTPPMTSPMALAGDRPVQTVGIMVFPCPARHHLFGDERIAVGTPFEIGGYTGITAPVAKGTFPVPFGKSPQDQPGGFDGLCSNGCQHAFLALLWVKKLTRLFYHKTR